MQAHLTRQMSQKLEAYHDVRSFGGRIGLTFDNLRPSKNIRLFLRYDHLQHAIDALARDLLGYLNEKDNPAKGLFLEQVADMQDSVHLAKALLRHYRHEILLPLRSGLMVSKLEEQTRKPEVHIAGQREFVNGYFRTKLCEYKSKHPNGRIYLILGNDDRAEIIEDVQCLHDEGLLIFIHERAVSLGDGRFIVGYPYVPCSGRMFYNAWEKTEGEIAGERPTISSTSGFCI